MTSLLSELTTARTALERSDRLGAVNGATIWHWDLATGRVEWDERLEALLGYAERVTDAAWRESRIHPDDSERVKISLQRATIASPGDVWSEQYRFRRADDSYASVTDRAYILQDDEGPCGVLGALTPTSAPGSTRA